MPDTTSREQSPDDSSVDNLTDIQERYFLLDFTTLAMDTSRGITTILDIIEVNEVYQSTPNRYSIDELALALSARNCKALQKLALLSARLLGDYAVKEIEVINARSGT